MSSSTKVNQQMIADHLNVSVATVSKALTNAGGVSDVMRSRVAEAATEMGYYTQPSRRRSGMLKEATKHRFIGVLERSSYMPGCFVAPEAAFSDMSQMASELNFSLVPQEILRSASDRDILDPRHQTPAMRDRCLSGMIVMGQWSADVLNTLNDMAPCVATPYTIPGAMIDQIGLDHIGSVSEIVEHLFNLGHRRIGFFGNCSSLSWASERYAGYVAGVSRLDLPYDPALVVNISEPALMEEGHDDELAQAIHRAVELTRSDVTAWVCSSDWPGNNLHRGLVEAGFKVPKDVSITGFDNSEPVTLGMPPLTSTNLPRLAMGKAAVKRMFYRLNEPDAEIIRIQFSCAMIDNGTTAKVPDRT